MREATQLPADVLRVGETTMRTEIVPVLAQAGTVIVNPTPITIADGAASVLEDDSLFDKLVAVQILSAEPPEHLDRWIFIGTIDSRFDLPLDSTFGFSRISGGRDIM
jgi:hypothetical protein